VRAVQVAEFCYCRTGIMSVCTAENEYQQKYCRFYEKSSYSDKCMYLVFDEYCDCLEAQLSAKEGNVIRVWEDIV
jgi:hypothetical protein